MIIPWFLFLLPLRILLLVEEKKEEGKNPREVDDDLGDCSP